MSMPRPRSRNRGLPTRSLLNFPGNRQIRGSIRHAGPDGAAFRRKVVGKELTLNDRGSGAPRRACACSRRKSTALSAIKCAKQIAACVIKQIVRHPIRRSYRGLAQQSAARTADRRSGRHAAKSASSNIHGGAVARLVRMPARSAGQQNNDECHPHPPPTA